MGPIPARLKFLPPEEWTAYRDTTARYESAWSDPNKPPTIDDFLPSPRHQPLRSLVLVHCIKEEYERRLGQGETVAMSRYFERFPELDDDPFAVQSLQSWEARLSDATGEHLDGAPALALPDGYRFIRELPRGGMSLLFLTENPDGRLEVLKQIDPTRPGSDVDLERFENEIKLAGDLAAKGVAVVPVSLVSRVGGRLAYTMPYCAGGSLRDRLKARGGVPLSAPDAAQLVVALARTVQKLQEEHPPIVHRDLKPENILFPEEATAWTQPWIADLGLAKVLGQAGPTQSGAALGTWVYMAPEQVHSPALVDGRADVYALGVILYESLTARRPFGGETAPEIIHRIYYEAPVDPSKLVPSVPEPLDEVVQKCLQKEPVHRYGSARELADDLQRFLAGHSVQAREPGRLAKIRSWARRCPKEALAYAAAIGALILGLVASLWWAVAAAESAKRAASQAVSAHREALRADDNAGLINRELGRLVERIGQDPRIKAAGITSLRNELLHGAVAMYDELVNRNVGQGTLGLGEALNNQALLQYLLGEIPQAIESGRRAEALLTALPPAYEARLALANAQKQLGVIYHSAEQPEEGLKQTQAAVTLYQILVQERPGDQVARFQLALATVNLGNYAIGRNSDAAISRYREALALLASLRTEVPDNPRYSEWEARTKSNLGLILADTGKIEAAIETHRAAVAAAEQVSDEFLRLDALASCRNNLGEALESAGHFAEGGPVFRESLNNYRSLASRFTNDVDYRWGVAMVLTNIAVVADHQGRPHEALGLLEESKKIFDDLSEKLGKNTDFQQHLAKNIQVREAARQHLDATGR